MTSPTRVAAVAGSQVLAVVLAGCGAGGGAGDAMVRDSAGITIVESTYRAEPMAPFTIVPEPEVQIGQLDGPAEYTFRTITGARRLADGRILVADIDRIHIYDAAGTHLTTFGRAGEGPGEFGRVRSVVVCGGEIIVGDFTRPHLAVFDDQGDYLRTDPMPPSGAPFPLGLESCTTDGAPLLRSANVFVLGAPGLSDSTAVITLMRMRGPGALDTLAHVPSVRRDGGYPPPFSSTTLLAYRDSTIYALESDRIELRSYGYEGGLRRIARIETTPRPVSADDLDRERTAIIEGFPEPMRAEFRADLEKLPATATMPAVSRMRVDPLGRAWLRPYNPRWEPEDTLWSVLDADGAFAGRVALPAGLTVHEIGEDYVLGVWQDELDVSYVRLYRIVAS